jgi:hypothetical protein
MRDFRASLECAIILLLLLDWRLVAYMRDE